MTRVARPLTLAMIVLMVIPSIMLPFVHAAGNSGNGLFEPAMARDTIDEFGYRLSFKLSDGIEVFSIRATFRVTYTYSQVIETVGEPFTRRHNMYVLVGFYYGKTLLGHTVAQEIVTDYIAFYPKWHDSAGYPHDLLHTFPMFMLNGTIQDGHVAGRSIVMDDAAVASYISEFGGTFVFSGLKFIMDDGLEILLSEEDVQIRVEKYSGEVEPREAVLLTSESIEYTADTDYFTATLEGVTPWFVILDTFLAVILWGSGGTFSVLGILHIKGRIVLPIDKLRRVRTELDR